MHTLSVIGAYNPGYPRTNVILEGCRCSGIELREHRLPWGPPWRRKLRTSRYLKRTRLDSAFVLVPFPCHHEVPVVRKHTSLPIVFDPLISRYMSKVHDLRKAAPLSLHGMINYRADKRALELADFVLADTLCHKEYFCATFGIASEKVFPLYVGYNAGDFGPGEFTPHAGTVVGFYGSFLPLHGVEKIVESARMLQERSDIRFEIVGSGFMFEKVRALAGSYGLGNITFLGAREYGELPELIAGWDICLGIFGDTLKAGMVIPNKLFHYAACRRPIVTRDSRAIRELFVEGESILLTSTEPADIAQRIEYLAQCSDIREKIAVNGYRVVSGGHTHVHVGKQLKEYLDRWS